MIRVLIADDHCIVRDGLKQLCEVMGDVTVAGEATNGSEVMSALQHGQFDLILLDLFMPGVSGVELVERIRAQDGSPPILIFSMRNEPLIAQGILYAGASGYITKESSQQCLVKAIREVAAGKRYVDPSIVEQMMFNQMAPNETPAHQNLSERERQVMIFMARGMTAALVAKELNVSVKTVSTHKIRLMEKMHFKSNADLVLYAAEYGLIEK